MFFFFRTAVSKAQPKIRKVERRSKRQLDYAETEYLRRQPKYAKSSAEANVSSAIKIKTASCRAVTIPCRNIAALSAARAEASARGGPPQGRAPQTSTRSYGSNRSSRILWMTEWNP